MTDRKQSDHEVPQGRALLWVRGAVRLVMVCCFIGVPLFWGAGTLDWTRGRLFLALLASTFVFNLTLLLSKNPTLTRGTLCA